MSENDKSEVNEGNLLSRRELLGASAALGTGAMVAGGGSRSAKAQTNSEPRIKLGDDYAIDDSPNGNGDLVIEHLPSGDTFSYDSSKNEWSLGSFSATSADITKETLVKAYLGTDQSISSNTNATLELDQVPKDELTEFDSTKHQFMPDETGWYFVNAAATFATGADGDQQVVKVINATTGTDLINQSRNAGGTNANTRDPGAMLELTAGDAYKVVVNNINSSDTILGGEKFSYLTIRSAFR